MPIILMNMLIGLAVGDIALIRREAAQNIAVSQADLILALERKLPERFLRRFADFSVCIDRKAKPAGSWYQDVLSELKSAAGNLDFADESTANLGAAPTFQDEMTPAGHCSMNHGLETIATQQQRLSERFQTLSQEMMTISRQQERLLAILERKTSAP
ncbi:uncharacterized protein LOC135830788 [Sycon ciliatum]|uniref:uncharacterized protein LOC135830788 n=1 Tax=Sycon ciliatum TaxID=27933 RepID=UPI0031F63D62